MCYSVQMEIRVEVCAVVYRNDVLHENNKKNQPLRPCTVIAIKYKWAEDYLLHTYSIFHTVVDTQPHDCCRRHNLKEIVWAKFCPFRNPLWQEWNFCGNLFCTKPAWFAGYTTSMPWKSQPGKHLPSCTLLSPIESHYDLFGFDVTQLSLSHWHFWLYLLNMVPVLQMWTPVHTHLVCTWWAQQELLTEDYPAAVPAGASPSP